jgi:hypothetical protein
MWACTRTSACIASLRTVSWSSASADSTGGVLAGHLFAWLGSRQSVEPVAGRFVYVRTTGTKEYLDAYTYVLLSDWKRAHMCTENHVHRYVYHFLVPWYNITTLVSQKQLVTQTLRFNGETRGRAPMVPPYHWYHMVHCVPLVHVRTPTCPNSSRRMHRGDRRLHQQAGSPLPGHPTAVPGVPPRLPDPGALQGTTLRGVMQALPRSDIQPRYDIELAVMAVV